MRTLEDFDESGLMVHSLMGAPRFPVMEPHI